MKHILEAIEGHDGKFLWDWVTRLKQSDGEGWAIGEMLERALLYLSVASTTSDKNSD